MTGFRLWGESQAPAGSLQSVPVRAYAHETAVVCRARRERSWPRPDSLGAVLGLGVVLACRVHEHISQKCLTQQAKPITHWSESLALRKLRVRAARELESKGISQAPSMPFAYREPSSPSKEQ